MSFIHPELRKDVGDLLAATHIYTDDPQQLQVIEQFAAPSLTRISAACQELDEWTRAHHATGRDFDVTDVVRNLHRIADNLEDAVLHLQTHNVLHSEEHFGMHPGSRLFERLLRFAITLRATFNVDSFHRKAYADLKTVNQDMVSIWKQYEEELLHKTNGYTASLLNILVAKEYPPPSVPGVATRKRKQEQASYLYYGTVTYWNSDTYLFEVTFEDKVVRAYTFQELDRNIVKPNDPIPPWVKTKLPEARGGTVAQNCPSNPPHEQRTWLHAKADSANPASDGKKPATQSPATLTASKRRKLRAAV